MSQQRLYIETSQNAARQIAARLESEFEDEGFPVASFETDEAGNMWTVSLYVPENESAQNTLAFRKIANELGYAGEIRSETLADEGWVEKTLGELAPVRAGRFVVHGSHDTGCAAPNEISVLIDAGMAFGTGHHGTTAGCLAMIDRQLKMHPVRHALDLGSGTGVLAIAIAKATRRPVLASDIDPVADHIARANARINNAHQWLTSITATGFNHRKFAEMAPFDLIVANILAGPLQALAPSLARHLAPSATVILSGLLPHQKARIVANYRTQGLKYEHAHYQSGWLTLVLSR
jgi:ribosomal protein L11 methyltransferase